MIMPEFQIKSIIQIVYINQWAEIPAIGYITKCLIAGFALQTAL